MSEKPHWLKRVLLGLILLVLVGGLGAWGLNGLGQWLVIADLLEPAGAIVVLSGHVPFRAMEAAVLHREGWAPEVWLTQGEGTMEEEALDRLGIRAIREHIYNWKVLERLGVAPSAIRLLPDKIANTADEVKVAARELRRIGGDRIILVTSKPHTRRVRSSWHFLVGKTPRVVVRYSRYDQYDPHRWWQYTRGIQAVSHEVFGLINLWLNLPVKPDLRERRK